MATDVRRRSFTFTAPGGLCFVVEWSWLASVAFGALVLPFFAIPSALALIVHELGHAMAVRGAGAKVERIELRSLHGLCVHREVESPRARLRIALAGALTELCFVLLLGAACEWVRLDATLPELANTVLFISARICWTILPLHALLCLVPGVQVAGAQALGSDGLAARDAWRQLRGTVVPAGSALRLGHVADPHRWAQAIAAAYGEHISIGRCIESSGVGVIRLRVRAGATTGACCDVAVRNPAMKWPESLALTSVRVAPWSPVAAAITWSGAIVAGALTAWSLAVFTELPLVVGLLFGGLGFAAGALALDRLGVGVDRAGSAAVVERLSDACRRVSGQLGA